MYKDFKKTESLDTGFVGGSGIMWMFSGIILGLLVGIGMYYFSNDNSPFSRVDTVQRKIEKAQQANQLSTEKPSFTKKTSVSEKAEHKDNSLRENKFSYYAVLPNLDVPVSSSRPIETRIGYTPNKILIEKEKPLLVEEEKQNLIKKVKRGGYLLQVASFKKRSKANLIKGRLSKKGIDAYVQKKKVKGRLWYRVVAGPVDQTSVDSWRLTAEKLGHRPLVISVR